MESGAIVANDWFFTAAVELTAGPTYTLEWWDRAMVNHFLYT